MKSCNCKSGASNTGVPFCVDLYQRTKRPIFQSIYDSTGVKNSIKDSDFVGGVLPKTYIDAMINHADPSKRWFVMPEVKNVTWTQSDPNTEDIDGIAYIVSDGNITGSFDFVSKNASDKFYGILESFKCGTFGMIPVTTGGELVGIEGVDQLYPQPLEQGTMSLTKAINSKTTVNRITVNFMYQEDFPVGDINYIGASSIEAGALDSINGLQDIVLEEMAGSTGDDLKFSAKLVYGAFSNKLPVEGLLVTEMSIDSGATFSQVFNETTGLPVAVTTLVESTIDGEEGEYVATVGATITSAQVVRVDFFKTGYATESITITIP